MFYEKKIFTFLFFLHFLNAQKLCVYLLGELLTSISCTLWVHPTHCPKSKRRSTISPNPLSVYFRSSSNHKEAQRKKISIGNYPSFQNPRFLSLSNRLVTILAPSLSHLFWHFEFQVEFYFNIFVDFWKYLQNCWIFWFFLFFFVELSWFFCWHVCWCIFYCATYCCTR